MKPRKEISNGWYCLTTVIFQINIDCAELCAYGSPLILTGVVWAFEFTENEIKTKNSLDKDCFETKRDVDDVFNLHSVWYYNNYWLHERVTWEIVTPRKPMSTEASLPLELNSEDGVNGSKILHPQNRGIKTCYFHWNTGVLQNKLVQSEGLFGRLVGTQTSEINVDKRLCMLQNYKLMVQIESYLLSKSVNLPFINPRYFFIILLTRCIMGQKTRFGVHSVFGVCFHWLPSRAVNIYIYINIANTC